MNFRDLLATVRLSDAPMTDVMVDIETTGTDPYHSAMIQLAAIQFNYETGDIGPTFNRCLSMPANRYWDESTRQWWGQQKPGILQGILSKAEEPQPVVEAFHRYIIEAGRLRFWSRGSFDWWFIQSYMSQYNLPMPFAFNKAMDLRAFQAGLFGKPDEPDMSWLTHPGDAHNALYDCVVQLKRLFSARDGVFYEVIPA
jgi:DNA polymerase III alpha subunit (gram-positive type)